MTNPHHVSIDIETFSDVDIKKAGLYKYAQSPAFEILLIAWVKDDRKTIRCLDLTRPKPDDLDELMSELYNGDNLLHAYNAAFEHTCINVWLARQGLPEIPLNRWRCTMAHGLYCGYTAGLGATGEAMGLPQDKRKLGIGAALIRKFCVPQKPDRSHPEPWRVRPADEPEKWELFKTYCRQDVETEREIERRLRKWPMPDREQTVWELTCEANAGGVGVDTDLVDAAIAIGEAEQARMMEEAREISGLDNPKSVQQLMKWLNAEMGEEVTDLRKTTVAELLERLRKTTSSGAGAPPSPEGKAFGVTSHSPEGKAFGVTSHSQEGKAFGVTSHSPEGKAFGGDRATRMLELRQLMSKTSTKKYDALAAAVCADGRVRGMLFYYGANRTGRWAGRIVQPQNLPQNHLPNLDYARRLVKARDVEMLRVNYGSVPDTLSQLIRTAFVPGTTSSVTADAVPPSPEEKAFGKAWPQSPEGKAFEKKRFAIADYSAIEARVVAWLAGEAWVLDAFRDGKDIYCATASQMFGVPVEKHGANAELRQRGKVAVLALGYGGGEAALTAMGALRMGIPEEDLPEIKQKWRAANPAICRLWSQVEKAAIAAVKTGAQQVLQIKIRDPERARANEEVMGVEYGSYSDYFKVGAKITFRRETSSVTADAVPPSPEGKAFGATAPSPEGKALGDRQDFLTVELPSGRKLFYAHPFLAPSKKRPDVEALCYRGVNQTSKKWEQIDTWGGKLVENITQAVARDCLAETLIRLRQKGMIAVFHVHDEVIVEVERDGDLDTILDVMAASVEWAPGLPLKGAGFVCDYYQKD